MTTIRHNRTYRDGSGVLIREEADGSVIGTFIAVTVSRTTAIPRVVFSTDLTDVPRADQLATLMSRFESYRQ